MYDTYKFNVSTAIWECNKATNKKTKRRKIKRGWIMIYIHMRVFDELFRTSFCSIYRRI